MNEKIQLIIVAIIALIAVLWLFRKWFGKSKGVCSKSCGCAKNKQTQAAKD